MKVVITGSKGFVGSHLIEKIKSKESLGYEIVKSNKDVNNTFEVGTLKSLVEDTDVVVHLAGANRASEEELLRVNVIGTLNLLEAIKKYSRKKVKFIFASSFQVYNPNNNKVDEGSDVEPQTVYGMSKKFSEDLIKFYSNKFGIKSVILRFSNIYGPGCKPNYNSVIATFCYNAVNNKVIIVNDKDASIDFVFVEDVVDSIISSISYNVVGDWDVFNICSGKLNSLQDIINIIKKKINVNVEYGKLESENKFLMGNCKKMENLLKVSPGIDFEENLLKTLEWYKNNVN